MKKMNRFFIATTVLLLLCSTFSYAQEEKRPEFISVTKMHWNMDKEDYSMDAWKKIEKEYMEKVTDKNEYVVGASFHVHLMTADSRELLYVQSYKNWEDMGKAGKRNGELEKEAWSDEKTRKDFLKNRGSYYADFHSDEIYATVSGAKLGAGKPTKDMVLYVRTSKRAFPSDGSVKEFDELREKAIANTINKNEYIKAYFPNEHAWGADKRDFIEAFYLDSLSDLEKMLDRSDELGKDAMSKEEWKTLSKYFTGVHGDYLYTAINL